jgi:hypothetical protein
VGDPEVKITAVRQLQNGRQERGKIMKRVFLMVSLGLILLCSLGARDGYPGEKEQPFQIALFNPVQWRAETAEIVGCRLNLIYGKNVSVKGLDVGLGNHCTGGTSVGLQYGLVGYVEGDFSGWQENMICMVKGTFTGYQSGLYNEFDRGTGFQMGVVNRTRDMTGFQLGLINYTETMYGLQIGLLNIIKRKETLPVFVIVNWSF